VTIWFAPLVGILVLIVLLGHRPRMRWSLFVLIPAFIGSAIMAFGDAGIARVVQGVCDTLGFCP
jgi:hypothetical protein